MPSSTSNSEAELAACTQIVGWGNEKTTIRYGIAIAVLLGSVLLLVLGLECVCRIAFDRTSKIQESMMREFAAAIETGASSRNGTKRTLIVGNSLLESGVDFPKLQAVVKPTIDARRLVVANTSYFDWYYGMKRLLARAHPDVIVVALSPRQFIGSGTRGDYAAFYLFDCKDLVAAARELNLHPTQAAGFFLAHFSQFYAVRAEVRNQVLTYIAPDFGRVAKLLPDKATGSIEPQLRRRAVARLTAMNSLAKAHGVQLVLLLMPSGTMDGTTPLREAAQSAGVDLIVPMTSDMFGSNEYSDGFHLNPSGAARFTEALAAALKREPLLATR